MAASADREPHWLDATRFLEQIRFTIPPGQLFCTPHFSLFEAMSAVEVGDPKLDVCATAPQAPAEDKNDGPDPSIPRNLTPNETIALMDHLLCMEAMWHRGEALLQTTLTCLPILQPEWCKDNFVLSAYCLSVRASCQFVRDVVYHACVCEDEDFVLHMGSISLSFPGDEKPLVALAGAEDRLTGLEAGPDSSGAASTSGRLPSPLPWSLDKAMSAALQCRLRFRRALLQGWAKVLGRSKQELDAARKHFLAATAELRRIRESAAIAGTLKPPGFDAGATRGFLAAAPPRQFKVLSTEDTWREWEAC
eukprot:jgi/Botrbrau1/6935/Bobra.0215s0014.1